MKKYLAADAAATPPSGPSREGCQPQVIGPFTPVIDAWPRADIMLRASMIYERLFAGYGFAHSYQRVKLYVAAARPVIAEGRVERQVEIVREHVLAGRTFGSLAEIDAAFAQWLPIRGGQVHRTHGQVITERATADRAALRPLPPVPYLVAELHLRRVGKDCLVSFEASLYSVPAC